MPPKRLTFEDTIRAEQASTEPKCGHTCRCHGDYVCVRTAHVHHGSHWLGLDGAIYVGPHPPGPEYILQPEFRIVHAGYTPDGQLATWSGPHLTAEQIDQAAAESKAAHANSIRQLAAALAAHGS